MNPDNQQTIKELGQRVKAKYPQYKDMDDVEVGRRTKAKHPEAYGGFRDLNIEEQKQELRDKGQAVSIQGNRAEPTAGGRLVRDITQVGARIGQNIGNIGRGFGVLGKTIAGREVTPEQANFAKRAGRTDFYGEVQPIGQQEKFGEALKDTFGAGLEAASFIPVGSAATAVGQGAKAVAKGAVKKGLTKQLAKEGLVQGALFEGGRGLQEGETIGQALGSAAKGGLIGGATGGAFGVAATKVVNPLIGKVASEFNVGTKLNKAQSELTTKINKAIGLRGKKTVGALSKEARGIGNKRVEGFEVLVDNAADIKVTDADGLSKVFEPKNATFAETIQALDKTKSKVYQEAQEILKQSGGTAVETGDVLQHLQTSYLDNPTYGKSSKNFVANIMEDVAQLNDPVLIDGYLKNEINPLLGKLISGSDAKNARIAADIHKLLTKKIDDTLALSQADIRGPYGQYSALKSIEKDLVARAQQQLRRVGGGLSDYADIFSIPEVFSGLITSNPALIAQGVGRVGMTRWFKAMKDPERLLRGVFKDIEKLKGIKSAIPEVFDEKLTQPLLLPAGKVGAPRIKLESKGVIILPKNINEANLGIDEVKNAVIKRFDNIAEKTLAEDKLLQKIINGEKLTIPEEKLLNKITGIKSAIPEPKAANLPKSFKKGAVPETANLDNPMAKKVIGTLESGDLSLNKAGEVVEAGVDDLTSQAKKFDSVDEFIKAESVKAQLLEDGTKINKDGTVTLYHATSPENKKKILSQGLFKGRPSPVGGMTGVKIDNATFFGTDKNWVRDTWGRQGNPIIEVNVPFEHLRKGAQNKLEVYFEGGLKRQGDIWIPTKKPQSTFYDRIKEFILDKEKLTDIWNKANKTKPNLPTN